MAQKKKPIDDEFLMFDVLYEDGSRTSHRKVPTAKLDIFDRDGSVRTLLEAQDRKIAEMSGKSRAAIKTITKSAGA
jgi:hypothetical protein